MPTGGTGFPKIKVSLYCVGLCLDQTQNTLWIKDGNDPLPDLLGVATTGTLVVHKLYIIVYTSPLDLPLHFCFLVWIPARSEICPGTFVLKTFQ